MKTSQFKFIPGYENDQRIDSRILEEQIQQVVAAGHRNILVEARGQHGIGGRLWQAGDEAVSLRVTGYPGQRVGSLGFTNTSIEIMGPASDDVGWLNAGAQIVVHGNASNGTGNGMSQGKIYVGGNIGARGMTMTKSNPRFDPPELWVLGSVGDYFGEFMAGGIAVVCGVHPQNPDNILGYRPFVGMVGGEVYFRGPHQGISDADAKIVAIDDEKWDWFVVHLKNFLQAIKKDSLYNKLIRRDEWSLLTGRTPQERVAVKRRSIKEFRKDVWEKELGQGGLIGDLSHLDNSPVAVITTGDLRRYKPVWENKKYIAPCEGSCPTGIPVQQRWGLIREGRVDEAVDLALAYTPFPATVCGYLCPNLCMQGCTRQSSRMSPIDVKKLGQASLNAILPEMPAETGKKIAVIGGGPAGISVAWQLRQKGHSVTVYDMEKTLGGKIAAVIPESRIPKQVLTNELKRIKKALPQVHLQKKLVTKDFKRMLVDYDYIVISIGAQKANILPVPGKEHLVTAMAFLTKAKANKISPGKRIVIIGAGNVGCDVATEAHRLGADDITLIDIQEPASFGVERAHAEAAGAKFLWPKFTSEVKKDGVLLTSGELLPADTAVISIGDRPDTDFLPEHIQTERGFIKVNDYFQTTDPKVFAIGDAVQPGLLTDAIGAGRKAAQAITDILSGKTPDFRQREIIDQERVKLEYFDPRITDFEDLGSCGAQCSSCGSCRDCGICVDLCPQAAISRHENDKSDFELRVNESACIGCGFCVGVCPCGIWNLVENEPYE